MIYAFTSVNSNYITNARILAKSVKQWHPTWKFVLLLNDIGPNDICWDTEPFDSVFFASSLPIADFNKWKFQYTVVELCTAVKGIMTQVLFDQPDCEAVVYLDPDTAIFSRFEEIESVIYDESTHVGVILTPHLTSPEHGPEAIASHEFAALKHGTFNLGFFVFLNNALGRGCLNWWAERVKDYSFIDFNAGLFTDQKWANLLPYMFNGVHVLTDRSYNVATWNMRDRIITRVGDTYFCNDKPLRFYHFSGFGNGFSWADKEVNEFSENQPDLRLLWDWYKAKYRDNLYQSGVWAWSIFEDREFITVEHRRKFIKYKDKMKNIIDPYSNEARITLDSL